MSNKQPQTLQHEFKLSPLRAHFQKSPNPPGANKLIDLPLNDFLDTEDEFNVVAAALWTLCVRYDNLDEGDKPKTRTKLREWILSEKDDVYLKLTHKVEPPFPGTTFFQMEQDVLLLTDELLAPTLPVEKKEGGDDKATPEKEKKA